MRQSPRVSIITVVYNAAPALKRTIRSIESQSFVDYEYLVIDGGSSDSTLSVIKEFEYLISFWISEPDKGIYHAMNKGLVAAKGDFVTFLNAGDYYHDPNVLKNLFSQLDDEMVLYGDFMVDPLNGKPPWLQKSKPFTIENLQAFGTAVVCHQGFFVQRRIAPLYNLKFKYKAELNWYFDILEQNQNIRYKHFPIPVVYYLLGGFGFIHFIPNLAEWGQLIISRFGLRIFFKNKLLQLFIKKVRYRYFNSLF